MGLQYIEKRDGGYWVKGTRVSLDTIAYSFQDGLSPETIATEVVPILTLEQVYGAITYYLANQKEIDTYLQQEEVEFDKWRKKVHQSDPEFYQKLIRARRNLQTTES